MEQDMNLQDDKSDIMHQERSLRPTPSPAFVGLHERWALIVGISVYHDERLNLKYADRDAEALYELIQSPTGGAFKQDHIVKLVNKGATTANVTRALRSFLKKPAKEDIVLLYFACHGTPDPERPDVVYLLTHDTEQQDIAGTALPMREIDLSLRENLRAERVVVIADTCHGAAIEGWKGLRGERDDASTVNAYLQQVGQTKGGVALLTSAETNETARESDAFKHGVFTYFLLQGLQGDADGYKGQPKDGIVAVGELFDYVRDKVIDARNHEQHPAIGTSPFDRRLPMAVTGGINAREQYRLGRALYELGLMLDDPLRFDAAQRAFQQALGLARLGGAKLPEAEVGLGQALLALHRDAEAIQVLQSAVEHYPELPEAWCHLGLAHARAGRYEDAVQAFETFLTQSPQHEHAAWMADYVEQLKVAGCGQKYALLIGIDTYKDGRLQGSVNDARLMQSALLKFGFPDEHIRLLLDKAASRQGILDALAWLAQISMPTDTIVIYYSGKVDSDNPKTYLISQDYSSVKNPAGTISAIELHEAVTTIAATNKLLLLDTDFSSQLAMLARREAAYSLIFAAGPGQHVQECCLTLNEQSSWHGLFTYHLARQLENANIEQTTYKELMEAVASHISNNQMPLLIGEPSAKLFSIPNDRTQRFFDFAQRQHAELLPITELKRQYQALQSLAPHLASAHMAFGQAFLVNGDELLAKTAFSKALEQSKEDLWAALALAAMETTAGDTESALVRLQQVVTAGRKLPPIVSLHIGRLLLALGNDETATRVLQELVSTDDEAAVPERLFYLGLAQARQGSQEPAVSALTTFLARIPADDLSSVRSNYAQWLLDRWQPRKRALLIGVGQFRSGRIPTLIAPAQDVKLLRTVLAKRFGFSENDLCSLVNAQATRAGVIDALKRLAQNALPSDVVVIYFSGHAIYRQKSDQGDASDEFFLLYDTGDDLVDGVTAAELHTFVSQIPSRNVTVILDSGGTQLLGLRRIEPLPYTLLLAASPGQTVLEGDFGAEDELPLANGVFTRALARALNVAELGVTTAGDLVGRVTQGIEHPKAWRIKSTTLRCIEGK